MTSAQVVETSVNVISNSPSQDYTHPDDRTLLYDMTPGFKPFTIIPSMFISSMWDVKEPTHSSKRVGREVSRCCGCPLSCSFWVGA